MAVSSNSNVCGFPVKYLLRKGNSKITWFPLMMIHGIYRLLGMGAILANAIVTSTMYFKTESHEDVNRKSITDKYYYIEVG